jgi:hypothetical protein
MMVRIERIDHGYRLTTHALVVRAVLVGTLTAVAVAGACVSCFRLLQSGVARGSSAEHARDRSSSGRGALEAR